MDEPTYLTIADIQKRHKGVTYIQANGFVNTLLKMGLIKETEGDRSPDSKTGQGRKSKVYEFPPDIKLNI